MKRKTREEKQIEHSESVLDDLNTLYNHDGRAVVEYQHLIDEYKRLYHRYCKTMHMSDSVGKDVMVNNEQLKNNIQYTVEKAKKKILYNISEHKKTKEDLVKFAQKDKDLIIALKQEIKSQKKYIEKLENRSSTHHSFEKHHDAFVKSQDINEGNIKNKSFNGLLEEEIDKITKTQGNLMLAQLTIDKFDINVKKLVGAGSDRKVLLQMLYKFFRNSLKSRDIVYFLHGNIFYIILVNEDIKNIKFIISSINVPKKFKEINFTYSIGITDYRKRLDTIKELHKRCNLAHSKAEDISDIKNSAIYDILG
jgi:GGDEF domain-containing protein